MEPQRTPGQAFYRWVDAQGRLHVVSSLDDVPATERGKAAPVTVSGASAVPQLPGSSFSALWHPDWASFGVGFTAALALAWLYSSLPSGLRWATRVFIVVGIAAVLGGAYVGLLRRTASTGAAATLASPSALVQDARDAVDQLRAREQQQEEEIRKIQAEGR